MEEVLGALAKTRNNSAPGPDGITYSLIKYIKETPLGTALIHDIARCATGEEEAPPDFRNQIMVIIPKPNKPRKQVKGWRSIVLINTVGKLSEKLVANTLQKETELFHKVQCGSRKCRSATSAMILNISQTQRNLSDNAQVTLLGKDIVSVFNNVRIKGLIQTLKYGKVDTRIQEFYQRFLKPREFKVSLGMCERGTPRMDESDPQGSPLPPLIWRIYIATTLKRADEAIETLKSLPHSRTSKGLKNRNTTWV